MSDPLLTGSMSDPLLTGLTSILRMSAKSFLEEAAAFRTVRSENWKGPTSRGGRRHATASGTAAAPSTSVIGSTDASTPTSNLWGKLVAAAGSDRQAEVAVASMQRSLLEMVENMPIDEIEQLAGE